MNRGNANISKFRNTAEELLLIVKAGEEQTTDKFKYLKRFR